MDEKLYYQMDSQIVINEMASSEKGIPEEEAIKRRAKYGLNELPQARKTSLIKLFFEQFKDILILILIVAIIIELIVIVLEKTYDFTDVIAIGSFVIINSLIGLISEYRSENEMLALKRITAEQARVIRPEGEQILDSKLLVPGELIYIEMGNKVPADARLIDVMNLQVDESSLTGESRPVKKDPATLQKDVVIGDRRNMIFSGTIATYGRGIGIVVSTGQNTQIGRIAQLLQEIEETETPLQKKMAKVGFQLGILIIIVCILVFIIGILKAVIIGEAIDSKLIISFMLTAVALAVAAMPSGLPIVITTSLALGMHQMAKERAIVKKLKSVETLGSVNVICSDKTGTLTKNEMTIRKIFANETIIKVGGVGYGPTGEFSYENKDIFHPLDDPHFELLFRIGALCGTSKIEQKENNWIVIGDPTEGCLLTLAIKAGINLDDLKARYPQIGEIPFTSELKRMTTIHKTPENEIHAYVKGAIDILLDRCNTIYRNEKIESLTENDSINLLKLNDDLSSQQLRILAMAYRVLEKEKSGSYEGIDSDLTFVGFVGMMDPPRDEVPPAIKTCHTAGIEVKMITGDHLATANAIGKEVGLISEGEEQISVTGVNFDQQSKDQIEKTKIFARISPEHKLKVVETLREKNYIVAATGDGVNDAPALKSANIGVAMGNIGTDVAKEASDMTLTDDNFATIVSAVKIGRNIYESILKTIFYLLSSNIGEILIIFVWILIGSTVFSSPALASILPLLPLQLLWVNLITDSLPAISLAKEPYDSELMQKHPRRVDEHVFTRRFTINILLLGVLICIGTLCMFYWGLLHGKEMWADEDQIYRYATTLSFMTVIMFENWNVLCTRSLKKSIFKVEGHNYYMFLSLVVAILLQLIVIYIPILQKPFHTYYLDFIDWIIIIAVSSSIIWVTEGYKLFWNWWDRRVSKAPLKS